VSCSSWSGCPPPSTPRAGHTSSRAGRASGSARALAADPPLLLLDEPFGALDPVTRFELQQEFRALQRRLGKTAVFVTHDLREATRVADRLALLAGGRLVATGTPAELRASTDPEVRAFLEAGAA
jgi:osmoprotectant transport system ATP-binding protein